MKMKYTKVARATFSLSILALALTAQVGQAATILTTDFSTTPIDIVTGGNKAISLGVSDLYVVEGATGITDPIDQWVSTNNGTILYNTTTDTYSGNSTSNGKRRGTLQIMKDSKATIGLVDVSMDVAFAGAGDSITVELYAWNTGDVSPGLSWGGTNGTSWNDSVQGGATVLLGTMGDGVIFSSAGGSGTKAVATNLDLGTGYDYYFWRVGMAVDGTDGPTTTFSNLSVTAVPEPTAASLLGLCGVMFLARRRRS